MRMLRISGASPIKLFSKLTVFLRNWRYSSLRTNQTRQGAEEEKAFVPCSSIIIFQHVTSLLRRLPGVLLEVELRESMHICSAIRLLRSC